MSKSPSPKYNLLLTIGSLSYALEVTFIFIDQSILVQFRLFLPHYRMKIDDKTIMGFAAFVGNLFHP
uniref:Uncharacterized protein n=1 Tax=Myoviridae sp. ctJ2i1 TaxID=2825079 RepID=A0A8S5V1W5_9CAUD|nr:MAG TPA: hypothetical protein [Myoviridae sp. ctJ2i1]